MAGGSEIEDHDAGPVFMSGAYGLLFLGGQELGERKANGGK